MQITVTELQETVVSFKKLCVLLVTLVLLSQIGLLYYMSAVNSSLSAAVDDDSWPPNLAQEAAAVDDDIVVVKHSGDEL